MLLSIDIHRSELMVRIFFFFACCCSRVRRKSTTVKSGKAASSKKKNEKKITRSSGRSAAMQLSKPYSCIWLPTFFLLLLMLLILAASLCTTQHSQFTDRIRRKEKCAIRDRGAMEWSVSACLLFLFRLFFPFSLRAVFYHHHRCCLFSPPSTQTPWWSEESFCRCLHHHF